MEEEIDPRSLGERILFGMWPVLLFFLILILSTGFSLARDAGQWQNVDPAISEWYRSLKQPDNPNVSCCGEADAYWCDDVHVKHGKTFCNITDDRDNEKLHRTPVPIGTEIEIPDRKLKWDEGDPTGHSIVFLSSGGAVYCFVFMGGS